jgi:hypothetical protein
VCHRHRIDPAAVGAAIRSYVALVNAGRYLEANVPRRELEALGLVVLHQRKGTGEPTLSPVPCANHPPRHEGSRLRMTRPSPRTIIREQS